MGALVLAACVGAGTARADTVAINLAGSINPPGGALPFNYTQGSYLTGFVFRANSAISITQLGFYDSNLTGVPETFVVDAKGVIRYQHIGAIQPQDVPLILQKLAEAAS